MLLPRRFCLCFLCAGLAVFLEAETSFGDSRQGKEQPILVVLTDIGGDPDDMQSMRRMLLYANELDIRGLIASATGTPGEVGKAITRPDLIREIIDDYESVRANLALHADDYPSAGNLRSVVASGDPIRTVDSIKPGASTAGSRLIVDVVDVADRPVYVAIWGGAKDLAQALRDVEEERSDSELDAFLGKLRVYAIGDQDGYNTVVDGKHVDLAGTGKWIKERYPKLRYVETNPPEISRFASLFRGMYQNDSVGGRFEVTPLVREGLEGLNDSEWLEKNVLREHGALGEGYPVAGQNPSSPRNTRGIKEGDTPSWFFVLPIGLSDPEHPGWGGWGGRFSLNKGNHFIDTEDDHWFETANEATRIKWTVARWREAYQNDFAARMDWCVLSREEANHPPSLAVEGDRTKNAMEISMAAGEELVLEWESSDPDGDSTSARWWLYGEVAAVDGELLELKEVEPGKLKLEAKAQARGKQFHVIGEVSDDGEPSLTRYRRVVVSVE